MEFKGFKGRCVVVGDNYFTLEVLNEDQSIVVTHPTVATVTTVFIADEVAKSHADNFADAHNVRQQINCSLTELLEQRNELLEALKMVKKEGIEWNLGLTQTTKETIAQLLNKIQS